MKPSLVAAALVSFVSLAGWNTERTASADPAPAPAHAPAKSHAKRSFWLAAEPHVPLAVVENGAIRSVGNRGKSCGAASRWAKPGAVWRAVDAWGQVAGEFEVAGSELYDVTHCHEVYFTPRSGKEGAGLFVSDDSPWKPAPSVRWSPADAELKQLEHMTRAIEEAFVDGKPFGKEEGFAERARFFEIPAPKDPDDKRATRWVVLGGPVLVVAYQGDHQQWKVSKVLTPLGLADSYPPVAVFDMNGDGLPEIVYHESDGPSFADNVLKFDPQDQSWTDVAESPGGATL
jgi:hypothetical protein